MLIIAVSGNDLNAVKGYLIIDNNMLILYNINIFLRGKYWLGCVINMEKQPGFDCFERRQKGRFLCGDDELKNSL